MGIPEKAISPNKVSVHDEMVLITCGDVIISR